MEKDNPYETRAGVTTLISCKIDLQTKFLIDIKRLLYNDKRMNSSRRYNNYKCIFT